MPIYEYVCEKCAHAFEALVRGEEQPVCPQCGAKRLARQFSAPAAHTSSTSDACPQRPTCPAKHCCGQDCGMGNLM